MDAKVTWKNEGLLLSATADSGGQIDLASKMDGEGKGFRPMELLAMGLAGCTAMDVISILQKKRQEITDFRVEVDAARADEHPKVMTAAVIEYHISGKEVDEKAVVRAIELSATRYCPAQAMLAQVFPMELKYFIYDESGELTISGVYQSTTS